MRCERIAVRGRWVSDEEGIDCGSITGARAEAGALRDGAGSSELTMRQIDLALRPSGER